MCISYLLPAHLLLTGFPHWVDHTCCPGMFGFSFQPLPLLPPTPRQCRTYPLEMTLFQICLKESSHWTDTWTMWCQGIPSWTAESPWCLKNKIKTFRILWSYVEPCQILLFVLAVSASAQSKTFRPNYEDNPILIPFLLLFASNSNMHFVLNSESCAIIMGLMTISSNLLHWAVQSVLPVCLRESWSSY